MVLHQSSLEKGNLMKKLLVWYYRDASIRKKLVISYLILISLPIIILGTYSYHIARKNLMEQTYRIIENNLSSIEYNLSSNIQRENDNIKYLSYNSEFRNSLSNENMSPSEIAQLMNNSVEPTFWYFITSDNSLKGIEVYSPCIEDSIGSFLKPIRECENEAWYPYHESNFKTQWTFEDGKIFATRTLLDTKSSSESIGVMKLEVYPSKLLAPLSQSEYLNNGVLVLDANNQIIDNKALENEELESLVVKKILDGSIIDNEETNQYVLKSTDELDNGWRIYYYVDKQGISGQLYSILRTTLLIVGLCLSLIFILISVISKILSRRILELKVYAERVADGDFNFKIDTHSSDEIGVVANSLSSMSGKLNDMVNQVYQIGLEKRASELKALQAMINPHFLYNCLSSIKWKAIRAEQDEISEITGLLAKFYRTTLNGGNQITTVKNELDNIISYLELQRRTHDDSFDVEYDLAKEGLENEMPNFLLQPIVENAICHGVDICHDDVRGQIKVQYEISNDFIIFNIYNNGPAMDKEQIHTILDTPNKGYGIYNIRERIRIYYDIECGVFSSITDNGMICFTVKIRKNIPNKI